MNVAFSVRKYIFTEFTKTDCISFSIFFKKVWSITQDQPLIMSVKDFERLGSEEQDKVIFQRFDLYNNGAVGQIELLLFFTRWGLFPSEIFNILNQKEVYMYPKGLDQESMKKLFPTLFDFYKHNRNRKELLKQKLD